MCVDLNYIRRFGDFAMLETVLSRVYGDDLYDVVTMLGRRDGEVCYPSEEYIFVRCCNYFDHLADLKITREIIGVLEAFDRPSPVPDSQIEQFRKSSSPLGGELFLLRVGDIVSVISGHCRHLKGIVVGAGQAGYYEVLFKLFSRVFTRLISSKDLVYEGSVFSKVKSPVCLERIKLPVKCRCEEDRRDTDEELTCENQLYRQRHRGNVKQGQTCSC